VDVARVVVYGEDDGNEGHGALAYGAWPTASYLPSTSSSQLSIV
jgi:hypothetical protein